MTHETHLVVIPSYNTGPILVETVREALSAWQPVWLIVDGSTDGSAQLFLEHPEDWPGLRVIMLPDNCGKGNAAFHAARLAADEGFTHMLLMDADGQHPAEAIPEFMAASRSRPEAMVLGQPVFGDEAPWVRLAGRQLSVGLVWLETLGGGVGDPLMGFRVYPLAPLLTVARQTDTGRRYDFDPEVAVRLFWLEVPPIRLPARVRYVAKEAGGVSHYHYLRDNLSMIKLHLRLLPAFLMRCLRVARFSRKCRRSRG